MVVSYDENKCAEIYIMAGSTRCAEIPTITEIDDVDHVRLVRAFNTTQSAKLDEDLVTEYHLIPDDSTDPGL